MPSVGSKRSLEGDDCGDADSVTGHDDARNVTHSTGSEDADDGGAVAITHVLDTIGIEVYKYLVPKELLFFSLSNHHVFVEVSKGLIQTCMRQLPPNFVCRGTDHSISFGARHSFPQKVDLMDHLLGKIETAELKLVGTEDQTTEDSLKRAREVLSRRKGAKFYSHNSNLPPHLQLEFTSAGYHHEMDNRDLAASRSEYILSRMAMEGEEMARHVPVVRTWLAYILAQSHVVAGTWFWSCRHRNLDFQGVEGKGVMISSPRTDGEEMEICWTRTTASRLENVPSAASDRIVDPRVADALLPTASVVT